MSKVSGNQTQQKQELRTPHNLFFGSQWLDFPTGTKLFCKFVILLDYNSCFYFLHKCFSILCVCATGKIKLTKFQSLQSQSLSINGYKRFLNSFLHQTIEFLMKCSAFSVTVTLKLKELKSYTQGHETEYTRLMTHIVVTQTILQQKNKIERSKPIKIPSSFC